MIHSLIQVEMSIEQNWLHLFTSTAGIMETQLASWFIMFCIKLLPGLNVQEVLTVISTMHNYSHCLIIDHYLVILWLSFMIAIFSLLLLIATNKNTQKKAIPSIQFSINKNIFISLYNTRFTVSHLSEISLCIWLKSSAFHSPKKKQSLATSSFGKVLGSEAPLPSGAATYHQRGSCRVRVTHLQCTYWGKTCFLIGDRGEDFQYL